MTNESDAMARARAVFQAAGIAPGEDDVARLARTLSLARPRRLPALETEPQTVQVVTPWQPL